MTELPPGQQPEQPYSWENVAQDMQNWHPDLQVHVKRHLEANGITSFEAHEKPSPVIIADEAIVQTSDLPTRIGREDIKPHTIALGETELILQRHGEYVGDTSDERVGSLTEEAADAEREAAKIYFNAFFEQIPGDERNDVSILFVASDTAFHGAGKRSYETALIAQEVATQVFEARGLDASNILNNSHDLMGNGAPRPMSNLREPQIFSKTPEFVEFLRAKYGDQGQDFWMAFEEDTEKETRQKLGAEGPDEITDRIAFSVRALSRYASAYHNMNPCKRLIIWADTHYDTISPFVKRDVCKVGKEATLLVDYGGGVTIDIDVNGNASTELGGQVYSVPTSK